MKEMLRELYYGDGRKSRWFRWGLLGFDIVTISYFVISSFHDRAHDNHIVDYAIAAVLMLDYAAHLYIANRPVRAAFRFSALADLIVILSLLASAFIENLAFLRVVRMLRLARSYHMLSELRQELRWFREHEQVVLSSINLFIFIFVVTAVVYVIEVKQNDQINNYMDALYFTVTTLTTTGFGDITMQDPFGRAVSVIIMVFGVGLFLRLVQTIFRPQKVEFACPQCGLRRHDPDAVHCKHCGTIINIPTEGDWG